MDERKRRLPDLRLNLCALDRKTGFTPKYVTTQLRHRCAQPNFAPFRQRRLGLFNPKLPKRIRNAIASAERTRTKEIHDDFFSNGGDEKLAQYLKRDLHRSAGPRLISDWNYTPSPRFSVFVKQALDGTLPPYTPPPATNSPAK